MTNVRGFALAFAVLAVAGLVVPQLQHAAARTPAFNARSAAAYLDGRMSWWLTWKGSARDHDTHCISCHTAVPYALARPTLRTTLAEQELTAPERTMLDYVVKRVRLWNEVEPFYPDQTVGIPKTSESRGTEAVLNALVLARRDAPSGVLSDDARQAFTNMWPLQFRNGDLKGGWAWLNFQLEPWESTGSPYFGAALAAVATGVAPGGYAASPEIQPQVQLLSDFLRRGVDSTHLFNRVMILWASTQLSGVLAAEQKDAIVRDVMALQHDDGGWSLSSLGPFLREDASPQPVATSDGYATGLVLLALQRAGWTAADTRVRRGLDWLTSRQDAATGMWVTMSLNKSRDLATDVGKFMSDAATAYAVMALSERH